MATLLINRKKQSFSLLLYLLCEQYNKENCNLIQCERIWRNVESFKTMNYFYLKKLIQKNQKKNYENRMCAVDVV